MEIELGDQRLPKNFWSRVTTDEKSGCWNFTGSNDRHGYGRFGRMLAHRLAYQNLVGELVSELVLDHLCRNPGCCNPAHLEQVTQGENLRRSPLLGRTKKPPPTCPQGHEFTPDNTLYKKSTDRHGEPVQHRICKTCNRRWCREYWARKKAINK